MKSKEPAIWTPKDKTVTIKLTDGQWKLAEELGFDVDWTFCFQEKKKG